VGERATACEIESEAVGFIGYAARKEVAPGQDLVRIFLNCEQKPAPEQPAPPSAGPALLDPQDLRPPHGIRFLHAVDVIFDRERAEPTLRALESLSAARKFNRFLGALSERARERRHDPASVFESAENLLATLARIKNARDFS